MGVQEPARLPGDLELVVMYRSSEEPQASSGKAGESEEGSGKAEPLPGSTALPSPKMKEVSYKNCWYSYAVICLWKILWSYVDWDSKINIDC